ncbi:DUF3037 domain-containing protein [Rufibacter glacialis]|uniref:DUF3037 domain-containing protein n=1 Tax=Rufibacter glacialis TaxID=1259555 RepID=A0A5M8Q967_9BACT|nr:DUF3037 domain-containing protein [Rufibacter glacialis]KAA6432429.1 DUF3037 domain-containing protein [Rufibacter glacialis]GGK78594.1 hypothetical protein GCM10011405_28080 [Rufibacter glacialis]
MQEKHLFEYATLRVVPCVEREEFLNVGVILYCPAQGFLKTVFHLNQDRLKAFSARVDLPELEERLKVFSTICTGGKAGGTIGRLPIASRFRWLTATRSTIVQSSAVHPGLCTNAQETLDRLFAQMVS